ncbi:MAG: hypothetical protein V4585_10385 [Bacteroidota bacterium]
MKKIVLTFTFFCLPLISLFSQNLAGKRIYNGNFSMNLSTVSTDGSVTSASSKNSNFALSATLLTGKIRENNTYTAYGFNVIINTVSTPQVSNGSVVNASSSLYSIGPAIQFGKFVKVFDQFYYAPNSTFSVSGKFGSSGISANGSTSTTLNSGGFGARANISPLNFIYQVNDNFLLSMNLGAVGMSYDYLKSSTDNFSTTSNNLSIYGSVTNFSGIGAYYLF